jgi:hypothetical protein
MFAEGRSNSNRYKNKVLMLLIYYSILHNPIHDSLTIFIFDLDRTIR